MNDHGNQCVMWDRVQVVSPIAENGDWCLLYRRGVEGQAGSGAYQGLLAIRQQSWGQANLIPVWPKPCPFCHEHTLL